MEYGRMQAWTGCRRHRKYLAIEWRQNAGGHCKQRLGDISNTTVFPGISYYMTGNRRLLYSAYTPTTGCADNKELRWNAPR